MVHPLTKIETEAAPRAIGPYSQAVAIKDQERILFVSGQLPVDLKTGKLIDGDIRAMTKQVLDNIEAVLVAGGSSLELVVRSEVFLKDIKHDFALMNEEYARRFIGAVTPARQTIQVTDLPMGSPIEISCIAVTLNSR